MDKSLYITQNLLQQLNLELGNNKQPIKFSNKKKNITKRTKKQTTIVNWLILRNSLVFFKIPQQIKKWLTTSKEVTHKPKSPNLLVNQWILIKMKNKTTKNRPKVTISTKQTLSTNPEIAHPIQIKTKYHPQSPVRTVQITPLSNEKGNTWNSLTNFDLKQFKRTARKVN